jgi:peptide/nickel transport system substrate-binding protein
MKRQGILGLAVLAGLAAAPALAQTVNYALPPQTRITSLLPIAAANIESLYDGQAAELLYRPLLWVDHNIQIDYARSIASSVTTKDGQHYFVKLNPKWHWSNGQPVTAQDVAFSFDLIKGISAKNAATYYAWGIGGIPNNVVSVKVLSAHELEFVTDHPYSKQWFELNGLAQLFPLPKASWDKYPGHPYKTLLYLQKNQANIPFFKSSPVDGPFMVSRFVNNQSYSFVPNPHYDGHKPSYSKLVLRYFTSSDAIFNAMRVGQLQVGILPFHLYAERSQLSAYTFHSEPQWSINYIYVNFANPKDPALKSLTVRKALQMAVDQPAMLKVIVNGQGVDQYGPVPYQPSTYLSPLLKSGYVPYAYDPAAGKALLEKAGWHMVNGVMQKGGMRLAFNLQYSAGQAIFERETQLIQQAAAKEGIKLTLAPKPFDTLIGELGSPKTWSLIDYGGWIYQPDYYPTGFGLFNSQGGSNQQGYSNPVMNRATVNTHSFYATRQQSLTALFDYENYTALQLPLIWLPGTNQLQEISKQLSGVFAHYNPTGNWSPQYWQFK